VEIRLLGRFDVVDDGRVVALGGPRQRAVLAVLVVHLDEIVSIDRLVDEVWAGNPPATAVPTLQRYVSLLRQALAGVPVTIETRRPGYVVHADPDAVDALRFERLVDDGRRHLLAGEPDAAARVLRDALSTWRGEPLADFCEEPFARFEATRLEELRSTAVELRIDADLAAGRHRDVVPELESLVAAQPLRESYRGQLMRALHGSGRRVEALRVYSDGRRVLAEEVGLDPSAPLQKLEQAILIGEPEAKPEPPRPRPLAAARRPSTELTSFVGRLAEVEDVAGLLSRFRLVTLTGVGGTGKSRLAMRVADVVGPTFAAGASVVELGAVTDPAIVPRVVAQALGVREDPDREVTDGLVEALRDEHVLLVVDGCEHLVDAVALLIERLLSAAPKITVLATSREILDVPGEITFRVPTLAVPADGCASVECVMQFDAVRLFVERATAADAHFVPVDADASTIAEVCRRLDGLPLALELAAARTDVLTLRQLAERLDGSFDLLDEGRRSGPARQRTLRATISWSYDLLGEDERSLLDRLSAFAGTFTVDTAEAVCASGGIESSDVFPLLSRLVRKSLVVRVPRTGASARYRLLDSLREFARERLAERGEVDVLRARHAAVFTGMAEAMGPALRGAGVIRILDELDTEHVEFRAALAWLLERDDAEASCRLAAALVPFWDYRFHLRDGRMWLGRVLALARHQGCTSPHRLWATIGAATFAMHLDDEATVALCDEGAQLAESIGDVLAEAKLLTTRGEYLRFKNESEQARALCTRAVTLCRALGDAWSEADAFRMLTLIATDRGDVESGTAAAAECLRLYETTGDIEKTAGAQTLVAALAQGRGEFERAAELVEESLARFQQVGEPLGIGISLWRLAISALMQGDYDGATRFAWEGLRLYQDIDYPRGFGLDYHVLTAAALARGDLDDAEALVTVMMQHVRSRGFLGDVVAGLVVAARLRVAQGALDEALACIDEGLPIAREHRYDGDTGALLRVRADVRLRQGCLDEARTSADEAYDVCRMAGSARGAAVALVTSAAVELARGCPDRAHAELVRVEAVLRAGGAALARTECDELASVAAAVEAALQASGTRPPAPV
jgi:predicted ATPase/DNA-binding SARP family transcriptional activator